MSAQLDQFVKRFLTGRINWCGVPRIGAIRNFGNIISLVLYRKPPFQVELFIVPHQTSSFTVHKHPNVDVVEFGLTGDAELFINGQCTHSREQMAQWLSGSIHTYPIAISPESWHSGFGYTPYSFLSIQMWMNSVEPSSVGLDWEGEPSSDEQEALWSLLDRSMV